MLIYSRTAPSIGGELELQPPVKQEAEEEGEEGSRFEMLSIDLVET